MVLNLGVLGSYSVPSVDPLSWADSIGQFVVRIAIFVACNLGTGWESLWKTISGGLLYVVDGAVDTIFSAINAVFTTSENLVGFMGPFAPVFAALITGTVGTVLIFFSLLGLRALEIAIGDVVKLL